RRGLGRTRPLTRVSPTSSQGRVPVRSGTATKVERVGTVERHATRRAASGHGFARLRGLRPHPMGSPGRLMAVRAGRAGAYSRPRAQTVEPAREVAYRADSRDRGGKTPGRPISTSRPAGPAGPRDRGRAGSALDA